MNKKLLATLLLVVAATFAAPMAANADQYTSGGSCSVSPTTVRGGQTATLTCAPETFADSEAVTYVVAGLDGLNTHLASFHASVSTASVIKTSGPNGSSVLLITVPRDASGAYQITGTGATSKVSTAATITVIPADDPAPAAPASTTAGSGLAATGSTITTSLVFVGIGLALAGIVVMIVVGVRRRKAHA